MMKTITALFCSALWLLPSAPASADALPKSDFFVPSAMSIDTTTHTATFPLHRGTANGKTVWYILTDASDADVAKSMGLVYAPDLADLGNDAIVGASSNAGTPAFPDAPDFTPGRMYVSSVTGFPPAMAVPGAMAPEGYSPFVRIAGIAGVLNAPIVATGDGPFDVTMHRNTHDRVIAIDPKAMTVTLVLARGFVDGKPVYYLSTEASDKTAATVERATYAPRLAKAKAAATIPIGVVLNGPQLGDAPQGLTYLALRTSLGADATADDVENIGSPFNVLSLAPDLSHPYAANGYSPLWSAQIVGGAQSKRLTQYADVASLAQPAGFVVNCPAIAFAGGY
ncbi:MAG: hypothetical protein JO199_02850 [Candidatus Eremiobacteraeota bacterium]|nr:hypothetical protein [Candidatus Eremiobacteraeota bacterium]